MKYIHKQYSKSPGGANSGAFCPLWQGGLANNIKSERILKKLPFIYYTCLCEE